MAKLFDLKLQGQTAAGAAIATLVIEYHSDQTIRFTSLSGRKVVLGIESGELAELVKATLQGATGVPVANKLIGAS
jgi:hypothetical protein